MGFLLSGQANADAPQIVFNVPKEPLAKALKDVADQGHVQVLFIDAEISGEFSRPLNKKTEPQKAFEWVIDSSRCEVRRIDAQTYVIKARTPVTPHEVITLPKTLAVIMPPPPQETVVVTARMGRTARTARLSSYAVTQLSRSQLDLTAPLSAADMLKAVPGLWVEASGGEASNNIRARGIPRDGFSSMGILEDGLPIQHDPGLGYLNADQSYRLDESIDHVDVVRGGPSSLFVSNAPGGTVNLVTRKPPSEANALLKLEGGSQDHQRIDVWAGTPLGAWRIAVSGFWRENNGQRPAGFRADRGGQWRLTTMRDFRNGDLRLDYKRLDDQVAFFLPIPVVVSASGQVSSLKGINAHTDTLLGPDALKARLIDEQGRNYPFDLHHGTQTRLDQYSANLRFEIAPGVTIRDGLRIRRSMIWRNGLFPSTFQNGLDRLSSLPAQARTAIPQTTTLGLIYVNDGRPFDPSNGNGLVMDATLSSVRVPLNERLNDLKLGFWLGPENNRHDVTMGLYQADVDVGLEQRAALALMDVQSHAQRLDVVARGSLGQTLGVLTRSGIIRDSVQFSNLRAHEAVTALYAADEWELGPHWRIDTGARFERVRLKGRYELKTLFNGNRADLISDDTMLSGSGQFQTFDKTYIGTSFSAGLTHMFSPHQRLYGRVTQTVHLPNATDMNDGGTAAHKEPIIQAELGVNLANANLDLQIVGFATYFSGYRFVDNVFEPSNNSFVQKTAYADTVTTGIELESLWKPIPNFDIGLSTTLQDPRFKTLRFQDLVNGQPIQRDFSQNRLLRVPNTMVRLTPGWNLSDRKGRLEAVIEYYSDRFTDAANSVRLPAYSTLGIHALLALRSDLKLSISGENLTNSLGLTEGNPRAGQLVSQDVNATLYAARPIFGRSLRVALKYSF